MKNWILFLAVMVMVGGQQLAAQAPSTKVGLIAHYLFNGDYKDQSGSKNHGQQYGGVRFGQDRFGSPCGAAQFNGRSAYVEVPHSRSLDRPQRELTVSTWFKLDAGATDLKWLTVVCKSDLPQETPNSPHFRMQATKVTLSLNTSFTENLNKDIAFNTWYHYAMVYDGTMVTAYLNGQPYFNFRYNGLLQGNKLPLNIGRDLPGNPEYFSGSLDDLRIYDRALSQREIKGLYNDNSEKTSPKPCSPPSAIADNQQPNRRPISPNNNTPTPTPPPVNTSPRPTNPPVVTTTPPAPVRPPIVTITDPNPSPATVQLDEYLLKAQLQYVTSKQDVEFKINNRASRSFNYNPNTGTFSASIPLNKGDNYLSITGRNTHGRDNQMAVVVYKLPPVPSPPPLVTIITPTDNPAQVTVPIQTLRASVQNVASKAEIKVYYNGQPLSRFDYNSNTKIVTFEVELKPNLNSFQVVAENRNGRDAQTGYLNLTIPQVAPDPIVNNPTPTGSEKPQLTEDVQQAVGIVTTKDDIEVEYDKIRMVLYDHERLDGDTVSVYLNDQLLVDRKMLQTDILDWIRVDLPRLQKGETYYIISQAWNLGTIPPNTMTLELYDQNGMIKRVVLESEPGKSEALRIIYK